MGMTIDKCLLNENCNYRTAVCAVSKPDNGCYVYRYFKDLITNDYENRLKADMVAMLEDLRLDFQEAELAGVLDNKELIFADEVDDLVQQKINALKENEDGNDQ